MEMNNIKCDSCEAEFELPELQTKAIERDVHLNFFHCPHCNVEYKSFFTNSKIRTRQEKITKTYADIRKNTNHKKHKILIERIDELVLLNKQEMQALRDKYDIADALH
jgi:hypothetical protein